MTECLRVEQRRCASRGRHRCAEAVRCATPCCHKRTSKQRGLKSARRRASQRSAARWWPQKLLMDDQCDGHGSLTVSPFHALRERTALPPCLPLRGRPCSAPPTRPPCILFVEKANLAWARSELLFRQEAIVCRELKLLAAHSYAPPSREEKGGGRWVPTMTTTQTRWCLGMVVGATSARASSEACESAREPLSAVLRAGGSKSC